MKSHMLGHGQPAAFKAAMDEDFGTPEAVAVLFELAGEVNRGRKEDAALLVALAAANLALDLALLGRSIDAPTFAWWTLLRLATVVVGTYTVTILLEALMSWTGQGGYNPVLAVLAARREGGVALALIVLVDPEQLDLDAGAVDGRMLREEAQVVAVEGDVEGADGKALLDEVRELRGEPGREGHAPGADADEGNRL